MGGLGDLFGALGELFGGVSEVAGESTVEAVTGGIAGALTGNGGDRDDDAGATFERRLAGAPRALNVNDL